MTINKKMGQGYTHPWAIAIVMFLASGGLCIYELDAWTMILNNYTDKFLFTPLFLVMSSIIACLMMVYGITMCSVASLLSRKTIITQFITWGMIMYVLISLRNVLTFTFFVCACSSTGLIICLLIFDFMKSAAAKNK